MATNFGVKFADHNRHLYTGILKRVNYSNIEEQIGSADDLSTSCTNLVNFAPLYTSEIRPTTAEIATFWKIAIFLQMFKSTGLIFTKYSALYGDDLTNFVLRSPKGRCYNQLILGSFRRRWNDSLYCLHPAFQNVLQYHYVNARNSADNAATSCKNLVNLSPVTPQFKRVEFGIFAVTPPQLGDKKESPR